MPPQNDTLARRINQPLLILYGLGTILGAGIYVLVGKVAAEAGLLAPLSFVLAAIIAWLTALSYSRLVVLFPQSAGEAVYVHQAFAQKWLTLLVGLLIILTGIVSAATLARGFTGYLSSLVGINENLAITGVILILTALAVWGIAESLVAAACITLIEILGLLIVLLFCGDTLLNLPENIQHVFIPSSSTQIIGVISGTFLALYAFIGFEDMVNIVEEVKEPEKTMPNAILWVVIISTILYVLIALVAIFSLPLDTLAASKAPLHEILSIKSTNAAQLVSLISIFAIVNGVLIQIIMASRVCYGLAKQYNGPRYLYYISNLTRTPIVATLIIAVVILLAALFFPLVVLAKITSFIILIIFSLVNLALWKLEKTERLSQPEQPASTDKRLKTYPLLAALLCISILVVQILL